MNDGSVIVRALKNSSRKIYIFLLFLIILVIVGSLMFMVEGGRRV
jgi:voltage-gated potassium channel